MFVAGLGQHESGHLDLTLRWKLLQHSSISILDGLQQLQYRGMTSVVILAIHFTSGNQPRERSTGVDSASRSMLVCWLDAYAEVTDPTDRAHG